MTPFLGLAFIVFILFATFIFRPKDSLKAKAQQRYRSDRRATRKNDRMAQR